MESTQSRLEAAAGVLRGRGVLEGVKILKYQFFPNL
jgi:hypothetical protein